MSRRGVLDRRDALSVVFHAVDEDGSGSDRHGRGAEGCHRRVRVHVREGGARVVPRHRRGRQRRDRRARVPRRDAPRDQVPVRRGVRAPDQGSPRAHEQTGERPAYYFHCADNREYLERSSFSPSSSVVSRRSCARSRRSACASPAARLGRGRLPSPRIGVRCDLFDSSASGSRPNCAAGLREAEARGGGGGGGDSRRFLTSRRSSRT